jgi:Tfp pilus assembly protein PilF
MTLKPVPGIVRREWRWAAIVVTALIAGFGALVLHGRMLEAPRSASTGAAPAPAPEGPRFVAAARCASCHPKQAEAHRASDHARAMAPATEQTVLGNFADAPFTHGGVQTRLFRRDGKFFVRTDGPEGTPGEFEIAYTFGFRPLQQYLIPFAGGRLQALGIAWDTRERAQGGQRWFALHPSETLRPSDPLHWTGREQTWNYQCAECHSTNVRKGYSAQHNGYATTWSEIAVSCEACHGPGAAHVAWAERRAAGAPQEARALLVRLGRGAGQWVMKDPVRGIAEWSGAPRSSAEVDACARCHARRRPIVEPYAHGRPLLDTHMPAVLEDRLYHADGQIHDEVYEYGSFLQSRMFRTGVTCSDCHEPHSLALRAPANGVCAQCHAPARFDTTEHHRHKPGSPAAACVSCHMPSRTYMVVDPRRDHSLRVPRPDLAALLGTPDACSACHRDRTALWAAEQVRRWYGPTSSARRPHFGPAIDAGRRGLAQAPAALARLASDRSHPGIARATALAMLAEYPSPAAAAAVLGALADTDPLVRAHALGALEALPPAQRERAAAPLLGDSVRAVRIAAARALADAPRGRLSAAQQGDLDRALAELVASERVTADRPESRVNLANLYSRMGRAAEAEQELRAALAIDSRFVPAFINLADLYRAMGRDSDGEQTLDQALRIAPEHADALHSLGLLRARQGRRGEAVELLRRAAKYRPDAVRFAYVHAVAVHDTGDARGAIAILEKAHRRRPANREVLAALVEYLRERGDTEAAARYDQRLTQSVAR